VRNLLAPDNCTMILIDHQPLQFAGVQNIDRTLLVNNVVGLAKTAKVFGVPTIACALLRVLPLLYADHVRWCRLSLWQ